MKQSSDYIHRIEVMQDTKFIVIEDLDLGGKSVTNNIENVIAEVGVMENIDTKGYQVIYKDSTGRWDGFDQVKGCFVSLNESKWRSAALKYINLEKSFKGVYVY